MRIAGTWVLALTLALGGGCVFDDVAPCPDGQMLDPTADTCVSMADGGPMDSGGDAATGDSGDAGAGSICEALGIVSGLQFCDSFEDPGLSRFALTGAAERTESIRYDLDHALSVTASGGSPGYATVDDMIMGGTSRHWVQVYLRTPTAGDLSGTTLLTIGDEDYRGVAVTVGGASGRELGLTVDGVPIPNMRTVQLPVDCWLCVQMLVHPMGSTANVALMVQNGGVSEQMDVSYSPPSGTELRDVSVGAVQSSADIDVFADALSVVVAGDGVPCMRLADVCP